jgi:DNA-directed RNA polymerase subunit L
MEVKHIKINDYSIKYNDSKYKNIIDSYKHLIPKFSKSGIQFQLLNSNEAFANSIRIVFNDELLVNYLNVSIFDINTDDKYILSDNIADRIASIPLKQEINIKKTYKLNVINNSNDIIKVYSGEIKNHDNSNVDDFNSNIVICTLKPNKYIIINNIKIGNDYGYNNSIYSIGSFKYQIINTDFTELSLNTESKDFELELITNGNINLSNLINKIYDNLYFRLKKLQNDINAYKLENHSSDITKILTDVFIINTDNNIYEIHIVNEYNNIGNLITRYVYNLNPEIELINYKLEHPLRHKIVINIKHSQYKKIINDAINNIIKDLDIFKKSLLTSIK